MTRGAVIGIAMFALGVVMQAIAWGPLHPITWVPLLIAVPYFAWIARLQWRLRHPRVPIPEGWHVAGIAIVQDDTGYARIINVENPVYEAERLTREAM